MCLSSVRTEAADGIDSLKSGIEGESRNCHAAYLYVKYANELYALYVKYVGELYDLYVLYVAFCQEKRLKLHLNPYLSHGYV